MPKKQRKKFDAHRRTDPKTKAAIVTAARSARSSGKTWADTFIAARRAGYKGTVAGLEIMLRKIGSGGKSKRPVRSASKKAGGRPGAKAAGPGKRIQNMLAKTAK